MYVTVRPTNDDVKPPRRYDSSRRLRAARASRDRVLDVAQERFLSHGYAETTIAAIAEEAGVSVDTVYKTFRGKTGLLRALAERGLLGEGPEPAETRSDRAQASEDDPRALMAALGRFTAEVAPRAAPMMLLISRVAESDREIAAVRAELDRRRLERMTHNARRVHDRGMVRAGLTVEDVADVFWTYSAPELYDLLVNRRGWSLEKYGAFVGRALAAAVVDD